jgi:hypothetical protein
MKRISRTTNCDSSYAQANSLLPVQVVVIFACLYFCFAQSATPDSSRADTSSIDLYFVTGLYFSVSHSFPQLPDQKSEPGGIITRLRVGRTGVRMTVGTILVWTGSGAYPASYSMGTRVISQGQSGRSVMLTTHLHLVPMLRSRARPLIPQYSFMAWRGKMLPLTVHSSKAGPRTVLADVKQ